MDTRTALLFLVILTALLVAGILLFLFRAITVLNRIEASARELETATVPLIDLLRRMAEEVEPVVKRTSERYRAIEEGLGTLSHNPLIALLSPILKAQGGPIHAATSLVRVMRSVVAGISRAREVLKHGGKPAPSSPLTQEESHGQ